MNSKIINIYSKGGDVGRLTVASLLSNTFSQEASVLLLTDTPDKTALLIENLNRLKVFKKINGTSLVELYLMIASGKAQASKLPIYGLKNELNGFHMIGPREVQHMAYQEQVLALSNTFDLVVVLSKDYREGALNIQVESQDNVIGYLNKEGDSISGDFLLLSRYRDYKHMSLRKIKRWTEKQVFKMTELEEINRAYHRRELLLLEPVKDIILLQKALEKRMVIL